MKKNAQKSELGTRTSIEKFRCTPATSNLLSRMSDLTDVSKSDFIHQALKSHLVKTWRPEMPVKVDEIDAII